MLDDVGFAASASLDELSQRAEVSTATLSRFARSVGCRDLRDLRLQLAQASGVGSRFLDPAGLPEQSAFHRQILGDIEATLRQHLSGFNQASFADAVSLLSKARMIHAFGMGGPSSLCSDELQVRLVRLGYPIAACHDPVMMRVTAATLGPEHALIVCSLTGITPELLDVVDLARNYDARIIAITLADSPWRDWRMSCCRCNQPKPALSTNPPQRATACCWPSTCSLPSWRWPCRTTTRNACAGSNWPWTIIAAAPIACRLETDMKYDTLIRHALIIDGSNTPGYVADVGLRDGRIETIGDLSAATAEHEIDATGRVLAPGFIDVHTHDDTVVIRHPQMLPKLSQGVTTVIVGNCGISASPVSLRNDPPDPMNLLGSAAAFVYPRFSDYRSAVESAHPALNVAALIGHTALRSNHMDDLHRTATPDEITAMRVQLQEKS